MTTAAHDSRSQHFTHISGCEIAYESGIGGMHAIDVVAVGTGKTIIISVVFIIIIISRTCNYY